MTFCVGLTGNIASGKTKVAQLFADLGIDIINADHISRSLTVVGAPVYHHMVQHFGNSIVQSNGELDRRQLRQLIFNNPTEKQWLEQLLHPLIREQLSHQVSKTTSAYCIVEIPLLVSRKDYPYLNRVLLIDAPDEVLIERVMHRDTCNREDAIAILKTQPKRQDRLSFADDVIENSGTLRELQDKVLYFHQQYLALSQ